MSDRVEASLGALDFEVVREAWIALAQTPMGRLAIAGLRPFSDVHAVNDALAEAAEAFLLVTAGRPLWVAGVRDVADVVGRTARGEVLDGPTLQAIGSSLAALVSVRRALSSSEACPRLAAIASGIDVDARVAADLDESFGQDGTLSVERWPELRPLRDAVTALHARVRETLELMVHGEELADVLQDTFWTLRDNRYVIPVRTDSGRWDLGVVHDTSNSGRTAFVEPHEIIALDNRRKLAEAELRAAEHRILVMLSAAAATASPDLAGAIAAAVRLDLAASRAALAGRLGATCPTVREDGVVVLTAARHPVLVLRGVDVVPNDLRVDTAHPILIVSGPNAGGKTVALKTVGLCAALVAHGNFVPAAAGARVDLFHHVLAAIGDAQTVTGDRSSFSGHVAWLAHMLEVAGPRALLLLDELCTGTDPQQGAALARAVLEHLLAAGARAVVTTHYASIKGLAAVDARFAVAGVVVRDGRPTFVVRPGLAGQSHALDVARRAGLPADLLARAEALLVEERGAAGALVDALEAELQRAREVAADADARAAALDQRAMELDARQASLERRARSQVDEAAADLRARIKSAEEAVGRVVADLQRAPSHAAAAAARLSLDALRGVAPPEDVATEAGQGEPPPVGTRVRDTRLQAVGEVVAHGRDGVIVRIGGITRVAAASELVPLLPAPPRRVVASAPSAPRSVPMEAAVRSSETTVDLRGMRVDDGLDAVDSFLARLAADGYDTGFVLHGHGSGVLKDGVRRWLRSHPAVLRSGPAHADQGGDAFTVVRLRA